MPKKEYINGSDAYRIMVVCGVTTSQPTVNKWLIEKKIGEQLAGPYSTILVDKAKLLVALASDEALGVDKALLNAWIRADNRRKEAAA